MYQARLRCQIKPSELPLMVPFESLHFSRYIFFFSWKKGRFLHLYVHYAAYPASSGRRAAAPMTVSTACAFTPLIPKELAPALGVARLGAGPGAKHRAMLGTRFSVATQSEKTEVIKGLWVR
jgi:hypothetical protein